MLLKEEKLSNNSPLLSIIFSWLLKTKIIVLGIEIKLDNVYGHPKVPLSENEYLKKFETCCEQSIKKIDQYKINQLQEFILNIEKKKNIVDLFNIV